jgi:hypothetical protein
VNRELVLAEEQTLKRDELSNQGFYKVLKDILKYKRIEWKEL